MMYPVCMRRPCVYNQFTIAYRNWDIVAVVSVPYGKESKYNILVVRITSDGQLGDSKPCCMCVNIMKSYGIRRVYYSDDQGNMCCQKVNQLDEATELYASHGLKMMIINCTCMGKKLPLTKMQKSTLLRKDEWWTSIK